MSPRRRLADPHFDHADDPDLPPPAILPELANYGAMRGRPARRILDTDSEGNAGASVELQFQNLQFTTVLQSQKADCKDSEIITLQVQVDNDSQARDVRADIVECRIQWGLGLTQQEAFFHPKRGTRLTIPATWFNLSARFTETYSFVGPGLVPKVYVSAGFVYGTRAYLTKSPPVYWQKTLLAGPAGASVFYIPRWADTLTLFDPFNAQAVGGGLRVTFQGTALGQFSQRTTMVGASYYPCTHWQIPAGASRVTVENLSGIPDLPVYSEMGLHL